MEINSEYNKQVINITNKKAEVNSVVQEIQQEQVTSATDKNASSALTSIGKSLVSPVFKPAQTKEEFISQIENISWLDNKVLGNRTMGMLDSLSEEWIVALSEVLHKADSLSPILKKHMRVSTLIENCGGLNKTSKLKNLKSFSPDAYNALNINLQKDLKQLSYLIINSPLQQVSAINECYLSLDDDYRMVVPSFVVFNAKTQQQGERFVDITNAVKTANKDVINNIDIENIYKSELPVSQIVGLLEFLTPIYNSGKYPFSKSYLREIMTRNYSYALENQNNQPVCGTDNFKPFNTKEQLKTELASMRTPYGEWMFSNDKIERIINNENDITELSKILHEIAKNDIKLRPLHLNQILMREGVTFDIIKPLIDFYKDVQSDDEYEKLRDILKVQFDSFFKLNEDELETFKNNVPLLDVIYTNFEDAYSDDLLWGGHQLFSILKNSKMPAEIFEQLLGEGIWDDINLSEAQRILKEENIHPENIKLIRDLKNNPKLDFLFEENHDLELTDSGIISILRKKLPDNFDLVQKSDIVDFLAEVYSLDSYDSYNSNPIFGTGMNYVDILVKNTDDTAQDARKLFDFLRDNNFNKFDRGKFFFKHSFADTLSLLNKFYSNPLLIKNCNVICDYDIDLLENFIQVADYAATLDAFCGAKLNIARDLSEYSSEKIKLKMNIGQIKSKMDLVSQFHNKVSLKLWNEIQSDLLDGCILTGENPVAEIKEENISFVDAFLNDERFSTYFDAKYIDFLGLLQKDIDAETLKFNLNDFYDFVERYTNNEKIEISNASFITFEGDFKKLSSKIEQISSRYPDSNIEVYLQKENILILLDSTTILTFDKEMNFISQQKQHEFTKEDGTMYTGFITQDSKLNLKNYVVSVNDAVYRCPRVEKLTSRYIGENGEIEKTKIYKASAIDGVFDIREIFPNGDVKVISSAILDEKNEKIEKHLSSPNGVTSDILYQNIDGNEKYNYLITDSNGNILTELIRTSKNIDSNTKITTINGKEYKVEYSEKTINIFDFSTGETTSIDLTKINPDKDPVIQELLWSLSGDELIKTAEFVNKIVLTKRIDSSINPIDRTMSVGPHKFIFEHELGHGKDAVFADWDAIKNGDISSLETSKIAFDETLNKIFEREKQKAKETAPEYVLDQISYFIADGDEHYNGDIGGLQEVIAETNAIQTTAKFHPLLKMRTQILQEYFPETIAYLLNNHLN